MQVRTAKKVVVTGVSSRFLVQKFGSGGVDVPKKVRHAHRMNQEGKRRAGEAVSAAMAARGWNATDLAHAADIPDPATVRDFMSGDRWPWSSTRGAIEKALGLEAGLLERIAKGALVDPGASLEDEVVVAIRRSELSRAAKAELEMHYYRLVDGDAPVARHA